MTLNPTIQTDTLILAALIAGEARGEPIAGQIAVGHVVRNRVNSPRWWGRTWRAVMLKPWQFSTFNPTGGEWEARSVVLNRLDVARSEHVTLATAILAGLIPDTTDGATHYHADYVDPEWAAQLHETCRIGRHLFYRERRADDISTSTT